ncbi:MAG: cbb3-type cytochrome c oxidase subunit I [Acidobacteriota bacterium]
MQGSAAAPRSEHAIDSRPWWATTDRLRIARIELGGVLAALLLGVQFALVLQAELLAPGPALVGTGALGGALSAYGLVLVFLFALPALPLVVGGLVLPPMVGADDFVFPGLNRLTLHLYGGAWVLIALALLGGSIDRTLRGLSATGGATSWTLAVASIGLHLLGLALACSALNLLVTAFYGRSEQSPPTRWPVLVWGLVTGGAVQLVVSIAIASLGLLLLFESATAARVFGGIADDPFAYERLVDFILHAGAAVVLLPALGIAFEVFATFSRKAPAGGLSNPLAMAALAVLSMGGSGIALVSDGAVAEGTSVALVAAHSGIGLLALVPATLLLYNLLATLAGGAIEISAALLHALNLVVLWTLGVWTGVFLATLSTGAYLQGSLFATAQLHFLLGGGAIAGLVTGLYYWWPRLMGRSTSELLGRTSAALLFAGFLLAFGPSLVAGSQGLSSLTLLSHGVAVTLERVAAFGGLVLFLGLVVVGWDLLASLMRDAASTDNPWGATTGEWHDAPTETDVYDFYALHSAGEPSVVVE